MSAEDMTVGEEFAQLRAERRARLATTRPPPRDLEFEALVEANGGRWGAHKIDYFARTPK